MNSTKCENRTPRKIRQYEKSSYNKYRYEKVAVSLFLFINRFELFLEMTFQGQTFEKLPPSQFLLTRNKQTKIKVFCCIIPRCSNPLEPATKQQQLFNL